MRGIPNFPVVMQERSNLAAEMESMQALGFTEGDILELNVGGNCMSTSRETLTQVSDLALTSVLLFCELC